MDFSNELDTIYARMFTDEILDALLALHRLNMEREGTISAERDYIEAKAALEQCLNDEQKCVLADIEAASHRNMRRAIRFAFSRGFYAGFREASAPGKLKSQYLCAAEEFLTASEKYCSAYSAERKYFRKLYNGLYEQLDLDTQWHLVSVDVLWDDRLLDVFYLCYVMVYNQALSIAADVERSS